MDDDDDLFASLGGSLMKNLLADLNDESGSGGLLSLEELEQELQHLDDRGSSQPPPPLPTVPEIQPSNTAASLVVRAQEQSQSLAPLHPQDILAGGSGTGAAGLASRDTAAPLDAWSLSLEKFTAASLQDDFLQADSARKAQSAARDTANQQVQSQPSPLLQNAEDYDVSEPLVVSPPPGLLATGNNNAISQSLVQQLTTKLETVVDGTSESSAVIKEPSVPAPRKIPTTPQNSMTFSLPKPPPPTPQNSITANIRSSSSNLSASDVPVIQEEKEVVVPTTSEKPPPPKNLQAPTPPNSMHSTGGPTAPPPHAPGGPPPGSTWNKPQQQPPPPHMMPPSAALQPPRTLIYSNPLPNARPIPASALASKFMSTRDISYVVHAILKPILTHQQQNAPSPFDYDRAFFQKAAGVPPAGPLSSNTNQVRSSSGKQKQPKSMEEEMESRDKKAQDWSEKQKTLGHTAKANVARPRALIAQPTKDKSENDEEKNSNSEQARKALWKARIYADVAYQAYSKVVETWHAAMGHNQAMTPEIAALLQPHLFKLLKCLGMVRNDQTQDSAPEQQQAYSVVNETALPLLMKLPKGRNLLSRVLEQALLPPAAVSVLLPGLFRAVYELPSPMSMQQQADPNNAEAVSAAASAQFVEERLFVAVARVLQTLPGLPGSEIVSCLDVVQTHSSVALSSPVRMQAVHALLQRGTQLAASDPNFEPTWKEKEEAFLKLLSS